MNPPSIPTFTITFIAGSQATSTGGLVKQKSGLTKVSSVAKAVFQKTSGQVVKTERSFNFCNEPGCYLCLLHAVK